jgi:hypothetical protein
MPLSPATSPVMVTEAPGGEGPMLHVDLPTIPEFKELAAVRSDACVSVYLPTKPGRGGAHANQIVLQDLTREALNQLRDAGYDKRRLAKLSEHFAHLLGADIDPEIKEKVRLRQRLAEKVDDVLEFWTYQSNGLGILATPESMRTFRLPNVVKPLAEVSDRYHLQPLVRAMTMPHGAYVLALTQNTARLLHVFVNTPPTEVNVPGMPKNLPEGLRLYERAPSINLLLPEYDKVLMQEYVHKVDKALWPVLNGQDIPLILASDEPLASMFRSQHSYPHLAAEMIVGNPDLRTDAQLSDAALPILDRLYALEIEKAKALYDELKPRRATADVSYAAHCATYSAISQLIVDLDEVIPGIVDENDGSVTYAASDDAETYSVVDEVAKRALLTGARVFGASKNDLPGRAPLVAILRFRL